MKQKGFTLIELVVVIVILGILAATALPRFVDLSGDAADAAARGVAGAMSSGATINVAGRALSRAGSVAVNDVPANICTNGFAGWPSLLQGGLPAGYTVASNAAYPQTCGVEGVVVCDVTSPAPQSRTVSAVIACAN